MVEEQKQPPPAMTHGVYSKFKLLPMTEAKRIELETVIKEQGLTLTKTDQWIVDTLARALAVLEICSQAIDEHGLFQDDADGKSRGAVTPLLNQFWAGVSKVSKLCSQLGLTPESRIRMGKNVPQKGDLASRIQEAKET